jgi:bifunctional oligoribonuclease and PAP phosphatase NrnA
MYVRKGEAMNILNELGEARTVGITGHVRPDGDCAGSTLGLYNYLKLNRPELDVDIYLEKPSDDFLIIFSIINLS